MDVSPSLIDIPWDDVLFRSLFPMIPWRGLFYLRGACRDLFHCVDKYFEVCQWVNLIQSGHKMNAETFRIITQGNTSIRLLLLRNFRDWLIDPVLSPVVAQSGHLRILDISNCSTLSNGVMISLSIHCRKLEELRMRDCPWLTPEAITSVAHGCPELHHLDLSGCWNVNDDAVIMIGVACRRLQFLSVSRVYGITDHSVCLLARNSAELAHLNIQGCWRVTNQAVTEIGEYCKKLNMLQVKDCRDINDISLARLRAKGVHIDVRAKKWELGEDMSQYLGRINLNLQI